MVVDKIIGQIEDDIISKKIFSYYLSCCHNLPAKNQVRTNSEIHEGHIGLGIGLNDIMLFRSAIRYLQDYPSFDSTHNYKNLVNPAAWLNIDIFQDYLDGHNTPFNNGISKEDGIFYGFEKEWLKQHDVDLFNNGNLSFFQNKIVAGEARANLFGLLDMMLDYDMNQALFEMECGVGIGAGTTAQLSAQYLGAMIAGPHCKMREYRLRKTKISDALDIGHFWISKVELKEEISEQLIFNGYDFSQAFQVEKSIDLLCKDFIMAYHPMMENCTSLYDILDVSKLTLYSDIVKGEKQYFAMLKSNESIEKVNITEYAHHILEKKDLQITAGEKK